MYSKVWARCTWSYQRAYSSSRPGTALLKTVKISRWSSGRLRVSPGLTQPVCGTARQAAESAYGFKVLVEEETDRILGAHLLGPDAAEVINLFALAIRQGLRAETLRDAVFAYPTGASDIAYML